MQCQENAQQQICEFKEIIKQVEEDEERKIHDIQIKYERKLHTEKETNTNLKGETGIMTQKVSKAPVIQRNLNCNVFSPCTLLFLSPLQSVSHVISYSCFFFLFGGLLCDHSSTVCRDRSMTDAQT